MNSAVFAKYKKKPQAEDNDDSTTGGGVEAAPMSEHIPEEWSPSDRTERAALVDPVGPGTASHEIVLVPPLQSAAPSASARETIPTPREAPNTTQSTPLFSPIQPGRATASERLSERSPVADEAMIDVADWDHINVTEEQRRVAVSSAARIAVPVITFKEAFLAIKSDARAWQKYVTPELKRVSDHVETTGFWGAWWSCLHTGIDDGSEDYNDRDFVLALQFVQLEATNDIHRRMMVTLFRRLERPARNAPEPAPFGQHWERLGFQGNDPSTDLRSTGILGVLQLLYLVDFYPTFCGALYHAATNPLTEFPFVLVGFNFSSVSMEALKERGLHDDIAARRKKLTSSGKNGGAASQSKSDSLGGVSGSATSDFEYRPFPVMHSLCEFYIGALFSFYMEWRQSTTRAITEFGPVKAKLRPFVRNNVSKVLRQCETAGDRKKMNDITSNKQSIHFSTATTTGKSSSGGEREFMEF
jgi:hypothetical protein